MAKVIVIEMKDGTKHVNDPALGWNLSTVEEIRECIEDCRYYRLTLPGPFAQELLYSHEIANVYEEGSEDA